MPPPSETPAIYRFEGFTLDLGKGCLHCGSEEVRLRPKPFEALRYVIERSGRLVSKDELTGAVWPDSFVSDNSLAQCFTEIRKALQDDDQRIIKTVARRGYLFNVPVERVATHAVQPGAANDGLLSVPFSPEIPAVHFKWLAGAAVLFIVLAATMPLLFRAGRKPVRSRPVILAVLPFQSFVQSEPDEFLELGMADALITRLSNLRQLAVRP